MRGKSREDFSLWDRGHLTILGANSGAETNETHSARTWGPMTRGQLSLGATGHCSPAAPRTPGVGAERGSTFLQDGQPWAAGEGHPGDRPTRRC